MRLLHTSDWHIGKMLYGASRRRDHEVVVAEIVEIARDFRPDLILHTGDLFDASMPSVEDMRLAIEMLDELSAIAPVLVIRGNHENPNLFALFNQLRGNDRLRFVGRAHAPDNGGIIEYGTADDERILVACLPFVNSAVYIAEFGDPAFWTSVYSENLAKVETIFGQALKAASDPNRDISVFAAHLHVTGSILANSERKVHIDDYATRPDAIPLVTYAAFGHIHKPQEIGGRPAARYAGSPIQIDFGELDERKSVVLVEARPGYNADVRLAELSGGRQLRRFRGTLDQLKVAAPSLEHSLASVVVERPDSTRMIFDRVCELLPETAVLRVDVADFRAAAQAVESHESGDDRDLPELFGSYLAERGGSGGADPAYLGALFSQALHASRAQERLIFDVLEAQATEASPT
jgi:exonuclease SbcD